MSGWLVGCVDVWVGGWLGGALCCLVSWPGWWVRLEDGVGRLDRRLELVGCFVACLFRGGWVNGWIDRGMNG